MAERGSEYWSPQHVGAVCFDVCALELVHTWTNANTIALVPYSTCQTHCLYGGAMCLDTWMMTYMSSGLSAIALVCMFHMFCHGTFWQYVNAVCMGMWTTDNLVHRVHGSAMDVPHRLCLRVCAQVHHVCSGHGYEWIWSNLAGGDVLRVFVSCLRVDVWLERIMPDSGSSECSYTYTYEESDSEYTPQTQMADTEAKPEEEPDFGDGTEPRENGLEEQAHSTDGPEHDRHQLTTETSAVSDAAVEEVTHALDSAHLVQTEHAVASKTESPMDGEPSTGEPLAQVKPLLSNADDVATSVVPEIEPLKSGQVGADYTQTYSRVRMFLVMELAELLHRRKIETVDAIAAAVTQANMVTQQAKAQLALALQCDETSTAWKELWAIRWLGSVKKGPRMDRLAKECGAGKTNLPAYVSAFGEAIAAMQTAGDLIAPTWDIASGCLSNRKKSQGWKCVLQAAGLLMGMSDARAVRPCADAGHEESWGPQWSSQSAEHPADDSSATQWQGWNWQSHHNQSWRQWNETPSSSAAAVDQRYKGTHEVAEVAMVDEADKDNDTEDESSSRKSVSLRPWKPNSITWTKYGLLEYLAEKHTCKRARPPWLADEVEPPWKHSRMEIGQE
eukprot:6491268-Amphidinium_carterae.1